MSAQESIEVKIEDVNSTNHRKRRPLAFVTLSEIMPEVRRLQPAHRTVGNWNLGQICTHLAASVNGSIDGFDLTHHRLKRWLIPRLMLFVTYRYGIPAGYTVDANITPPNHVDLSTAIGELADAIERYAHHTGLLQAHPLFGRLDREQWDRLQCFHCAHHLSFVIADKDVEVEA